MQRLAPPPFPNTLVYPLLACFPIGPTASSNTSAGSIVSEKTTDGKKEAKGEQRIKRAPMGQEKRALFQLKPGHIFSCHLNQEGCRWVAGGGTCIESEVSGSLSCPPPADTHTVHLPCTCAGPPAGAHSTDAHTSTLKDTDRVRKAQWAKSGLTAETPLPSPLREENRG